MELKIDVCTEASCKVVVKDITEIGNNGYLPEEADVVVKGRFKYSDTISIDLLQHNRHDKYKLQDPIFSLHDTEIENVTLPVTFDGWFTVLHIVLPTKEWFDRESAKETGSALSLYTTIYYCDNEKIYKYINGTLSEVTIAEIVERNPEGTTISKVCENYVSICFLKKCYVSLCQQILNERCFSECPEDMNTDSELVFKRDYVWMAINVVKYLVQFEQLAEAERVLELIGGCNGLCKSEFRQMSSHRCGCCR